MDLRHHSTSSPKSCFTKPPLAQSRGWGCSPARADPDHGTVRAGESTVMPTGCYILVFFRALAEVFEEDFLKMFSVCICMEWPGTAKISTQTRSTRRWAARKGKDGEKMKCDLPSREAGNPMTPPLHRVTRPCEMQNCTKYAGQHQTGLCKLESLLKGLNSFSQGVDNLAFSPLPAPEKSWTR